MKKREMEFHKHYEAIFRTEKSSVDMLAEGFEFVLLRMLKEFEREMEILRVMGDKGGLVKEQIKHSTIQHAKEVFEECYFRATGDTWVSAGNQQDVQNSGRGRQE